MDHVLKEEIDELHNKIDEIMDKLGVGVDGEEPEEELDEEEPKSKKVKKDVVEEEPKDEYE